jgi:hypothetical protein
MKAKLRYYLHYIGYISVFGYAILTLYTFFMALTSPGYAITVSVNMMGEYQFEAPIVIFSIPFVIYVFIDSRKKLEDLKKNAFKNVSEAKI